MAKETKMMKKMCVLGDEAVGKTSLIHRYVYDIFDDSYIATIGTKTTAKALKINLGEGVVDLKLQIWDILGQKGFKKLHSSSFRGANGFFLVADITRKDTLVSLDKYWIPKAKGLVGDVPFVILINKVDLMDEAEFSAENLKKFASKHKVPIFPTSAKSGSNVQRAFHGISKMMIENKFILPTDPTKLRIIHPRLLFAEGKGDFIIAIDDIIDDFCRKYEGKHDAMHVMRRQFSLAKVNINKPTKETLLRLVDELAKVEMEYMEKDVVASNRKKRRKWIKESIIS